MNLSIIIIKIESEQICPYVKGTYVTYERRIHMSFIETIKERARKEIKTIVLPESEDRRTYEAAATTLKEGNAKLILIGDAETVKKNSEGLDISGVTVVDPLKFDKLDEYVEKLYELRKAKGMTPEQAREVLTTDYTTFGVMMVKANDADGMVAGACHATADVLRPSLQILKTEQFFCRIYFLKACCQSLI